MTSGASARLRTRGRWPGADALIDDCADAVAALRELHPELPLALLGESMGGSVALASLASGRVSGVDGLILAAPGVRSGVQLHQLHDLALRLGALALPWLTSRAAPRRPALARARGIGAARRGSPDPAAPERRHLRRPDRAGQSRGRRRPGADCRRPCCCTASWTAPSCAPGSTTSRSGSAIAARCAPIRSAAICCSTRETPTRCSATACNGCAGHQLAQTDLRRRSPSVRPTLRVSVPARRSGLSARRPHRSAQAPVDERGNGKIIRSPPKALGDLLGHLDPTIDARCQPVVMRAARPAVDRST